MIGFYRVMLC